MPLPLTLDPLTTRPMPAFPDLYTLRMDAAVWTEPLIAVETDKYAAQRALKDALLSGSGHGRYVQCPPEAEALAWEALELLLPSAARDWPQHFTLTQAGPHWIWTNSLLQVTQTLTLGDPASLPLAVLDWLGRQFQEDLVLMGRGQDEDLIFAAGHLCFGSGWSLSDKRGKRVLDVHAEVPGFRETAGQATDGLLRRLKAGRPVGRWNWTLSPTDRLNLDPALAHKWEQERREITAQNAGERCFLRAERQTLSRLPRTGGVLFTIHTYLLPVSSIAANSSERNRLLRYVRSLPAEVLDYRGMTDYSDSLIAYLAAR